ncbi:MAG TPA: sigma-70 family RNA polymerase sigma factor [Alphaproteobacteria bacterium]|nr:sigma-70 family RNA polymerase sigma factor [Alphaproteobacteria bacterium]
MNALGMTQTNDADLVAESLAGNREAFGQIVARYQTLVCSLAYSGTGSLNQSEDLAQETFIIAWKQIAHLREPQKLRSWLCGIVRNLTHDALKKQGREPSYAAEPLDAVADSPAPGPQPHDATISNEEAAILWRSLERVPETYREPLILFYRDHQSVEAVATNLELTEEAVRQRLSRGRKLLQDQVLAFVESALSRSNPGPAFTVAVLAVLPAMTVSSKAAMLGTAAKGGAVVKGAGWAGLLTAFGPFLGMWMHYRLAQKTAQSDAEKELNRGFIKRHLVICLIICLVIGGLLFVSDWVIETNPLLAVSLWIATPIVLFLVTVTPILAWARRVRKEMEASGQVAAPKIWEYRSPRQWFGLPFIHIRFGDYSRKPLKAWIAIGDHQFAFGMLFACGGVAIAPVSIGGLTIGLVSLGGFAAGMLTLGGFAAGAWAIGGFAFGWQAIGGCAVAWDAACGGMAISHNLAWGGEVRAAQATNPFVWQLLMSNPFFRLFKLPFPFFFWLNWTWAAPLIFRWLFIARRNGQKGQAAPAYILLAIMAAISAVAIFQSFGHHQESLVPVNRESSIVNSGDATLTNTLTIKAFVDGSDAIKVSKNELRIEHLEYKLPEKFVINGNTWIPKWDANTNAAYEFLSPEFNPSNPQKIRVSKLTGRGDVGITQWPSPKNNETLGVWIYDYQPGASEYEFQIAW